MIRYHFKRVFKCGQKSGFVEFMPHQKHRERRVSKKNWTIFSRILKEKMLYCRIYISVSTNLTKNKSALLIQSFPFSTRKSKLNYVHIFCASTCQSKFWQIFGWRENQDNSNWFISIYRFAVQNGKPGSLPITGYKIEFCHYIEHKSFGCENRLFGFRQILQHWIQMFAHQRIQLVLIDWTWYMAFILLRYLIARFCSIAGCCDMNKL